MASNEDIQLIADQVYRRLKSQIARGDIAALRGPAGNPGRSIKGDPGTPGPPGESPMAKSAMIDIGPTPQDKAFVVVFDPDVTDLSSIISSVSANTPEGKDEDEVGMDAIAVKAKAGNGQITFEVSGLEGPIHDKFIINYTVT